MLLTNLKENKRMRNFLLLRWTELSYALGVGSGFLIFYLLYSTGFPWEISFAFGFTVGFLTDNLFNSLLTKARTRGEIKKLSKAVEDFETH